MLEGNILVPGLKDHAQHQDTFLASPPQLQSHTFLCEEEDLTWRYGGVHCEDLRAGRKLPQLVDTGNSWYR